MTGAVIYPSRSVGQDVPMQYRGLMTTGQVQQVYLDELSLDPEQSLGVKMAEMVVADEEAAIEQAKQLIQLTQTDSVDAGFQENVLKLIQAVIIYKLGYKSLQELRAMFTLDDVKKTRLFQEIRQEVIQEIAAEEHDKGKLEGKLEAVPRLLDLGLTIEKVAEVLELDVEIVRKAANRGSE